MYEFRPPQTVRSHPLAKRDLGVGWCTDTDAAVMRMDSACRPVITTQRSSNESAYGPRPKEAGFRHEPDTSPTGTNGKKRSPKVCLTDEMLKCPSFPGGLHFSHECLVTMCVFFLLAVSTLEETFNLFHG
ncbi:hypothetical protein HNY73_022504 [Argiope bruennichi]|uniref:Uncharacterized protein n=1 Tax=Argiope bruennichi TaxID=94029 RepID=A0A8T0E1V6_ARGBR|nr:hypothetical protein HNY73_022504 [Argiope bruennichi]